MTKMTEQEATKAISEKTEAAMKLIREAEAIADENNITFSFDIEYGMGGTYYPDGWNSSGCEWEESSSSGWVSSSQTC